MQKFNSVVLLAEMPLRQHLNWLKQRQAIEVYYPSKELTTGQRMQRCQSAAIQNQRKKYKG